jgi:hypothetical protein
LGAATLLVGCATGFYVLYGYDDSYGYGYGSGYYDPYYYGPTLGFGYTYRDNDGHDQWRDGRWRDHDGRWRDRGEWRERAQTERRNEPYVSREQQHRDDITQGIAPPDHPSQDIGQYSR